MRHVFSEADYSKGIPGGVTNFSNEDTRFVVTFYQGKFEYKERVVHGGDVYSVSAWFSKI